jgi:hypothetical protein
MMRRSIPRTIAIKQIKPTRVVIIIIIELRKMIYSSRGGNNDRLNDYDIYHEEKSPQLTQRYELPVAS